MNIAKLGDIRLHYREDGNPDGPAVVFANALGTDLRIWDQILPLLPRGYRYIRFDIRGHGLSGCPKGPYSMGALVKDAEQLLDHLRIRHCVFVGLSIGGMIAQGLAVKRLDLVRGLVLSNTAAKIGNAKLWQQRISQVQSGGIEAIADDTMTRWFSRSFQKTPCMVAWRNMLTRQPVEGYTGCCAAISGTDFYTPTASLRLPTLGIAGSEDGSTPPDLVRETINLIPGSKFHLIRRAGHVPCIEQPQTYADLLRDYLDDIGHHSHS